MSTTTKRPDHQWKPQLAKANDIRLGAAALRREIRALPKREAQVRVHEVIENPPPEAARLTVEHLLTSVPRWGRTQAEKMIQRANVRARYVSELDDTERMRLALVVRWRSG